MLPMIVPDQVASGGQSDSSYVVRDVDQLKAALIASSLSRAF
jgi:hypothetical protein